MVFLSEMKMSSYFLPQMPLSPMTQKEKVFSLLFYDDAFSFF